MAQLEGITIRNYRGLREITLGKTIDNQDVLPLPRMLSLIGPNGCGKSSVLDALGFVGDCLASGVEDACDRPHRGGFERLRTRGQIGAIEFEIYYRQSVNSRPISYSLHISSDRAGRPRVEYERFRQRRQGEPNGRPYSFLELKKGTGFAWTGESKGATEGREKSQVALENSTTLGITVLGALKEHPRVVAFREFLQGWYLSYFVPDLARAMPMSGAQRHLNQQGDNLANYAQYMERQAPGRFKEVLRRIAAQIPGIKKIHSERQKDGRLLLKFDDRGYEDPFYAQDMSDGTLKMFAYLLLLEDPEPHPLIGLEEPENGLYHKLLTPLAQAMRKRSASGGPQTFVTTHSPQFVDALTPDEVWVMEKDSKGHCQVKRAAEDPMIVALFQEEIPMGSLWFSNHFGWGGPA